jgi:hypothetical protein
MSKYLKVGAHYFRVTREDRSIKTKFIDRPPQPPASLWGRLWWYAKDEWYRIQWEKQHE